MHEQRILVTGYVPHTVAGEYDVVDRLAHVSGMSPDVVFHLEHWSQRHRLDQLHDMTQYAAAVSLRDVAKVLPSATDMVVFDSDYNLLSRLRMQRAQRIKGVIQLAEAQNITVHLFRSSRQWTEVLDEVPIK